MVFAQTEESTATHNASKQSTGNLWEYLNPPRYSWKLDGGATDNAAIGNLIHTMENVKPDKRPQTIVSLITGTEWSDYARNFQNVRNYFKPEVAWIDSWDFLSKEQLQHFTCKIRNQTVNNPNYFFDYDNTKLPDDKKSWCTNERMLSKGPDKFCYNFAYQASKTGFLFARSVKVQKNTLWKIKGDWSVTVLFSILSKNEASDEWVRRVFKGKERELSELHHFPKLDTESMGMQNALKGIKPFEAFALMNYNAFKGYMTHCAILSFKSQGKAKCKFCEGKFAPLCKKWLPFLPTNRKDECKEKKTDKEKCDYYYYSYYNYR